MKFPDFGSKVHRGERDLRVTVYVARLFQQLSTWPELLNWHSRSSQHTHHTMISNTAKHCGSELANSKQFPIDDCKQGG